MAGVKIRHPHLKDVNFVVVSDREYEEPFFCPQCNITHVQKAYHLRLDSEGETTVSVEVFDRLAEIPGLPLTKVGKDNAPRPQALLMPGAENQEVPKTLEEAVSWAKHATTLPVVGQGKQES